MLFHTEMQKSAHYIKDILLVLQSYLKLQQLGVRKFFILLGIKPLPFFFSSSFIYSLKLLYIFSENLAYFGNCNSMPRSICKTAYTRHAEKAPPEFLPHGKVKPNFFQRQVKSAFSVKNWFQSFQLQCS